MPTYWKIQECKTALVGVPFKQPGWFDMGMTRYSTKKDADERIKELIEMPFDMHYPPTHFRPVKVTEEPGKPVKVKKK